MQDALEQARLARAKQQRDEKVDAEGKVLPVHSAWLLAAKAAMMNGGQGLGQGRDNANMAVFKPSPPSRPLPAPQRPWDPSGGGGPGLVSVPSNQPTNNPPTNQNNPLAADVKGAGVGGGVHTPPRMGGVRIDIDPTPAPVEAHGVVKADNNNNNNNINGERDRREFGSI